MSVRFNSSVERVVEGSASEAVDSGLIPNQIQSMTVKSVFTVPCVDAQH